MRTTIGSDGLLPVLKPSRGPISRVTRDESGLRWRYEDTDWKFVFDGSASRIDHEQVTLAQLTYSWTRPIWVCGDQRLKLERVRVKHLRCMGLRVYEEARDRTIAYIISWHCEPTIEAASG